jgi:Holliday junction resolvase RusA-like endonuclease
VVIEFVVLGIPAPQGSKSAFVNRRTGKAIVAEGGTTEARSRHKSWRYAVSEAARAYLAAHPMAPIDEPVSVSVLFSFPPTKSDPYRVRHANRPDIDKLVRSVLDSLQESGMLSNDARVWSLHAEKQFAVSGALGARIRIVPKGRTEARDAAHLKTMAKGDSR